MVGRRSLYTPDRIATILEAIRLGNDKKVAAAAAGIGESTFYMWLAEKSEFLEAVEKAEADAEAHKVSLISAAAETTWTAAAWWLERKHPERWARTEKQQVTGKDGEALKFTIHLDRRDDSSDPSP